MDEAAISSFWNANPCGDHQVGGLRGEYDEFFARYDAFRYEQEPHILRCLDEVGFADQQTLEIGLGQGADSEQIIRRGGRWSGLDLTPESVSRVEMRMKVRGLSYEQLKQGSVLEIPYQDDSFDIVFSHGVLHHVPDIIGAQKEIARVLRKNGQLVIMMYAKYSLNYLLSIAVLRRLGLLAMYGLGFQGSGIYREHLENARKEGLFNYLAMENFIHRNTDGPHNPYAKVYTLREVERDFPLFRVVRSHKEHLHAPPLPVHGLPGASLLGWHLWVHLVPR